MGRLVAHICPLCGDPDGRVLLQHRGRIVRCVTCGLVRRDPVPDEETLRSIYAAERYFKLDDPREIGYGDYYADEAIYRPYFARKIARLDRYLRPGGRLVEVGAAAGYALDEARRAGWDCSGLELSASAGAYAERRFGVTVRTGGIDDLAPDASWDVVLAFQVIEHLPDLKAGLERIRGALRPGGIAVLTTPDHDSLLRRCLRRFWPSYRPEHLVYLDRRTARPMLAATGLEVSSLRPDDRLNVPLDRLIERAWHYYFRSGPRGLPIGRLRLPVAIGDMEEVSPRGV